MMYLLGHRLSMMVSILGLTSVALSSLLPFSTGTFDTTSVLQTNTPVALSIKPPFDFFGTKYDTAFISRNGLISFVSGDFCCPDDVPLPHDYPAVALVFHTAIVEVVLHFRESKVQTELDIGVNAGDGVGFEELPQSRTPAVLNLSTTSQATTIGLYGFPVGGAAFADNVEVKNVSQPAGVYCLRNQINKDLVDVIVKVCSNISFYLQALNTTSYENGRRLEAPGSRCRTEMNSVYANLSFTVNVSDSDDPGCGVVYVNGFINVTIEAVKILGFYQGNDTIFRLRCNILPSGIDTNHVAGDINSTTVQSVTGRSVSLRFQDQREVQGSQTFSPTDNIVIGRFIFPTICFERGLPYSPNVDTYGVYAYSCQLANNQLFKNDGDNKTMDVIDSNGCLLRSSGQTGGQVHNFIAISTANSPESPFCLTTGGFEAFLWTTGNNKIYMRCLVSYCRNTQIYGESKCKDSCRYTLIDSEPIDLDDSRKKRSGLGEGNTDEVVAAVQIIANLEKSGSSMAKDCIDKTWAEGVIITLLVSLIMATLLLLVLFCYNERRSPPALYTGKTGCNQINHTLNC